MDFKIFNLINQLASKWYFLDYIGIFFAKYFEYFLWAFLIILLLFNFKKYLKVIYGAVLSAILARFIIVNFIRLLWFRDRPFVDKNINLLLSNYPHEASFPSGHAAFYFAISFFLFLYNKKIGILLFIASFLIVVSRVFVGIHWPTDILVGVLIGILCALLVKKYGRIQ